MDIKLVLILVLTIICHATFGQSKKDLKLTVLRLQSDSTSLDKRLKENIAMVSKLNSELIEAREQNEGLHRQVADLTLENEAIAGLSASVNRLKDSIQRMNSKLDSIDTYFRIVQFVKTFYNSLETSDEENLRQYEYGDLKFDLDNFYSMVSKNARYSEGRVKNLTDDRYHNKYYIKLESIEEIKFSLNKILVKTKVMYSGDRMGLFYNEEQLTLRDNKGLLRLTDWVDLDLYKMAPTLEASVENFTREDFYRWLDGKPR